MIFRIHSIFIQIRFVIKVKYDSIVFFFFFIATFKASLKNIMDIYIHIHKNIYTNMYTCHTHMRARA